ncbi:hypothetical protein MARPU_05740 [Marichromatium purpuratum 984]|uniref:Uncharacterized protein n=1 Tax=Marichromatium purpuratum 984 TaxID=765910 RepID=W0E3I5_MARPU|nr:hypothetical protein MARPU_05740 [Marichromatium purpuratum 984]
MQERMLFRVYRWPAAILLSALAAYWLFGVFIPPLLAQSPYISSLAGMSQRLALLAIGVGTITTTIYALLQSIRLWRWWRGKGDACTNCGGMVEVRTKKDRIYTQCLACGVRK